MMGAVIVQNRRNPARRAARGSALRVAATALALGGACSRHQGADPGPSASTAAAADADPLAGDAALRDRLHAAVRALGPGYEPRTRHRNPDGSPLYINRLILESSPYLLQHAHNPVDWFAWSDEAFELARRLGRPVLLSVGYSTCHWCHVMEEESFEDEEVARFINAHFVPVKVDREERPDVDAVYMTALQLMTGNGGWPMTLVLGSDRKPFFAGTYFPARDGDRPGMRGLLAVLGELSRRYADDPGGLAATSREVVESLERALVPSPPSAVGGPEALDAAARWARARFDPVHGGTLGAPKFPANFPLRALLRHARSSGHEASRDMALKTLSAIARGGIHDHVGGGFHRYSVDERWRVPHFEKMLYDNALLAVAYLEAHAATADPAFEADARDALDFLAGSMRAGDNAFFSATDADSVAPSGKREEGYYFTWTRDEIAAALVEPERGVAITYFGVGPPGDVDGRSVLTAERSAGEVADELGLPLADFERHLAAAVGTLRGIRERRPPPLRDEKIQTDWNALAVSAFARAAVALGDERYATVALGAAEAIERDLVADGALYHSRAGNVRGAPAFADDLALWAAATLDLFELGGDPRWLDVCLRRMAELEAGFRAPGGGYYRTSAAHESLLARELEDRDGVVPSASSIAALTWLRLAAHTGDAAYRAHAEATLAALGAGLTSRPQSLAEALLALDFWHDQPKEIALVLPDGASRADPAVSELLRELGRHFVPSRALVVAPEAGAVALAPRIPWLEGKRALGGKPTVYVCELGRCELPAKDAGMLRDVLTRAAQKKVAAHAPPGP